MRRPIPISRAQSSTVSSQVSPVTLTSAVSCASWTSKFSPELETTSSFPRNLLRCSNAALLDQAVFGDMRKAQIEELGELLQSCNIRLRRLDLQYYFMTKENARESVALLLRSQELQHLDLWTGYPHTLPSPPPSFALRSLSINFSDPERANYLLASSRTTLHSLQLRVQSYERDRIDLSAFPFLTSLSLFYTTPDTISNGLNLSLCTSIRHLHLEVSPPPSFAWSPSLDSLTIRNKPLPLATLLDFLHSPQSSQLRQIRFPTHASYPHALPSWRLDEVEEMLDVCEQRGVWVQLEGKKGLKGLEKLCEQRGVWTILENGWAS